MVIDTPVIDSNIRAGLNEIVYIQSNDTNVCEHKDTVDEYHVYQVLTLCQKLWCF